MYYIGCRVSKIIPHNDEYWGSGVRIGHAIKKHGTGSFKKEILHECDNKQTMYDLERKLVHSELLTDPLCYNLVMGGQGGWKKKSQHVSPETRKKISDKARGRKMPPRSKEHCERIAKANTGKKASPETREKMRLARLGKSSPNKGHKTSDETKKLLSKIGKGRKLSEETKQKMSIAKKGYRHSTAAKRKMSESWKARTPHKGYKHTEESKLKMSETRKRNHAARKKAKQMEQNNEND